MVKEKTEGQGGGYACGKYAARQNSERRFTAAGGSVGALPWTPFRELFEKSSLKTLKNFSAAGGGALGAGRLQRVAARGGTGALGGVFGCRAGIVRGGFYIKIGGKAS